MPFFWAILVFAISIVLGMAVELSGIQIGLHVGSIFSISFVGAAIVFAICIVKIGRAHV